MDELLVDVAEKAGARDVAAGMSACWGDYNNDGYIDLLFGRKQDSRLWRNNGPDGDGVWTFTDVSEQLGLFDLGVFHDAMFVDVDNDTFLDVHSLSGFYTSATNALPVDT